MKKRLRLKRSWIVVITAIATLAIVRVGEMVSIRIDEIKKIAEQCDLEKKHTCSAYEIHQYR